MARPTRSVLPEGFIIKGQYKVEKCIHSKGMANVYIVRDLVLNKRWCMKEVVRSNSGKKEIEYVALLQESRILRSISHSGIPRITMTVEDGDSLILIEDFIDGSTLSEIIEKRGPIRQDVALNIMKQLVQIIIYLHGLKTPVLYRDMKPDNVIIQGSDGSVKLLDFGTGVVIDHKGKKPDGYSMGTDGFAAPEQKKKDLPCDLRSDIYGLGMTFYNMVTGVSPFRTKREDLRPVRVLNPAVTIGMERIINKCIEENPDDRYQSCIELLYDIQNINWLDDDYRKRAKKKVAVALTLLGLSIILMLASFIPYFANKAEDLREYNNAVAVAEQSGLVKDYDAALRLNSLELRPYFGLINAIKSDGEFSLDEEEVLLRYVNPNLSTLKGMSDYGRLAFEIGKLYWFYYSDNGTIRSVRWFEDAGKEGYNSETANVYYSIGVFDRDIKTSITEADDAGMYAEYWNNLKEVQENNVGDVVTIQTKIALADCINIYTYSLKRDGITYEDIINQVTVLERFVRDSEVTESGVEVVELLMTQLTETVSGLRDRVNRVYGMEGGITDEP